MRRKILADSGPLLALVDRRDTFHGQASRQLADLLDQHIEVMVPYPVLYETQRLVLHRLGTGTTLRWLREMEAGFGFLNPTARDHGEALRNLRRYTDQSISLTDALTAVLALDLALPVWTYDHHFDILGAPVWR